MNPALICLILGFLIWGGVLVFQHRQINAEARAVFEVGRRRGEISETEAFDPYRRAFLRTSDLRVGTYRLLATLAAVISVPVTISVVGFLWARVYYLLERPAWMTEGELVHSFVLAVSAMLGLVGVAAVFARRYHQYRPAPLSDEWEREIQSASVPPATSQPDQNQ